MDKFDVLQRTILVGDDDDPGAMRQARKRGPRLLERLRQALSSCQTKALYAAAFIFGKTPDLEQPMNEEAKPQLGRQSAGRGVRRIEQPGFLQVGHDVTDRRSRQILREAPRQRTRANRFAGSDVTIDDHTEDLATAFVQFVDR